MLKWISSSSPTPEPSVTTSTSIIGDSSSLNSSKRYNELGSTREAEQGTSTFEANKHSRGEEGERVVEESFRFINDEVEYAPAKTATSFPTSHNLIQHRNSEGEIDAVYERKNLSNADASTSDGVLPLRPPVSPRPLSPQQRHQFLPRTSPNLFDSTNKRRRDGPLQDWEPSQQGTSTEVPIILSNTPYYTRIWDKKEDLPIPAPTSLRRASNYYQSCDFCPNLPLQPTECCPVCGRVGGIPQRRLGKNYDYLPSVLAASATAGSAVAPTHSFHRLNRHPLPPPPSYQPHAITVEPLLPSISQAHYRNGHYRKLPSPNANAAHSNHASLDWLRHYGKLYPWEYDYHDSGGEPYLSPHLAYHKYGNTTYFKKRQARTQKKAFALAVVLLVLALVITAGVVLAAISY